MRVLITNNTLAARAGSELYVRDLATGLLDRGITPIVYSTMLGEVAEELRRLTVPVIDDLEALAAPPDLIHGQHHLETMTALLHFPGVPAVYFCHGWLPWEEMPPRSPRILRYVAVDQTCRDRLVCEQAIPEDRVRVLLNFVDLERFKPRPPLPARPARALIFSNNANEQTHAPAIREACRRSGIALDVVGLQAGNACANPEALLGGYDLVFAKARSAIEALAVGAAVVLCDANGVGEMVTTGNLERLRPLNFGIRALREPVSAAALQREIGRYDARDAGEVSRRIRTAAGRDAVVDEVVALYREVIAEGTALPPADASAEARAAAAYLRALAPRLKERDGLWIAYRAMQGELDDLQNECAAQRAACDAVRAELAARDQSLDAERQQGLAAQAELERMRRTLGWRLLSCYGPIKYRWVLPAYHRVKKLLKGE
ncbi:MAG TPA: glycosyltransferase [Blastocatellia bacterium]|nr:glycosyltransferase [Blastocatellia bacterium]